MGVSGAGEGFRGRARLAWPLGCRAESVNDHPQAKARVGARRDEGASQSRERKSGQEATPLDRGSEDAGAGRRLPVPGQGQMAQLIGELCVTSLLTSQRTCHKANALCKRSDHCILKP